MTTEVEISLQHEAIHRWPDAFEEVKFLKHPHRHIFHIQMRKVVAHDDRDVEIIKWKRDVESYLKTTWGKDWGTTSCEQMAKDLLQAFDCSGVRVMEDGENGAVVTV